MKAFTITNTGSEAFLVEQRDYGAFRPTQHILQPGADIEYRQEYRIVDGRAQDDPLPSFAINVRDKLRNVTPAVSAAEKGEDK